MPQLRGGPGKQCSIRWANHPASPAAESLKQAFRAYEGRDAPNNYDSLLSMRPKMVIAPPTWAAESLPRLANIWLIPSSVWTMLAEFTKFGQIRPSIGCTRLNFVWPKLAKVGPTLAEIGSDFVKLVRLWVTLGRSRPKFGRARSEIRPKSVQIGRFRDSVGWHSEELHAPCSGTIIDQRGACGEDLPRCSKGTGCPSPSYLAT